MRGIYVLGTPHGGTSMTAGILHHLGVDMGQFRPSKGNPYDTFECEKARAFYTNPQSTAMPNPGLTPGFRRYLEARRDSAEGGPWGLKVFGGKHLLVEDFSDLIRVVRVFRPLEDVINADNRNRRDPDAKVQRAGHLASGWEQANQIQAKYHLALGLDFKQTRIYPRSSVELINGMLKLGATEEQIEQAVAFIQ